MFLVLCIFVHLCLLMSLIPVVFLYDVVSIAIPGLHSGQGILVLQSSLCRPVPIYFSPCRDINSMSPRTSSNLRPTKWGTAYAPTLRLSPRHDIDPVSILPSLKPRQTLKGKIVPKNQRRSSSQSNRTKTRTTPVSQTRSKSESTASHSFNLSPCRSEYHSNASPSTCVPC